MKKYSKVPSQISQIQHKILKRNEKDRLISNDDMTMLICDIKD